jgi:hypothetical protein
MAKEWSWSFSRLKNYETCPLKHNEVDILKHFKESTENLAWGNKVHENFALALKGGALPTTMVGWQHWIDWAKALPGELLVEQKYAITRDYQPTEYFHPNVWMRTIADVVAIDGDVAVTLDWKTGKLPKDPSLEGVQLALVSQCLFAFFPNLKAVKAFYVWLKEDTATDEVFRRSDMPNLWTALLPRVMKMEQAARTGVYQPKPSGLCRNYCPVTTCQFHGKGGY